MEKWTPYAVEYNPLAAGSIDGTDTEPHDRAIARAMNANFTPSDVHTKSEHTIFVGRLPCNISENKLHEKFSRIGKVEKVSIIRDVVTGQSKGYGFVEFCHKSDASEALRDSWYMEIEGHRLIIDREAGHSLKGWIPRRLGGGWGGRKEAGQLRFGCRERPWKKPIVIPQHSFSEDSRQYSDRGGEFSGYRDNRSQNYKHSDHARSGRDRYSERERRDNRYERGKQHYERHGRTTSSHHRREEDRDDPNKRRGKSDRHSERKDSRCNDRNGKDKKEDRYDKKNDKYRDYNRYDGKDRTSNSS